MGNGYVLIKTGELKLISYNEKSLPVSIFAINSELNKKEEVELAKNINGCFTNVCCNKKSNTSTKITSYLNEHTNNWKLEKTAKCLNISEQNIESALYTRFSKKVIVEITTGSNVPAGKIASLNEQGIKIENYSEKNLKGYKTVNAYLPNVDATITDIMLPNTTISIFAKGKIELYDFAKEVLKLRVNNSYSSNNI